MGEGTEGERGCSLQWVWVLILGFGFCENVTYILVIVCVQMYCNHFDLTNQNITHFKFNQIIKN